MLLTLNRTLPCAATISAAQRRVAIHVLDVIGEHGIGMVDQSAPLSTSFVCPIQSVRPRVPHDSPRTCALPRCKQSEFGIGPESAVFDPSTEEIVLSGDPEGRGTRTTIGTADPRTQRRIEVQELPFERTSPGLVAEIAMCLLQGRRSNSSSASRLRIQSPVALSIAEFFCAA